MLFGNADEKPSSRPRNWPNPTEQDLNERPQRIINISSPQDFFFINNFVKTSKYEFYNFLPKFLLEEFDPRTKIANCYFLMISALQCIPQISNTSGYPTTMIPLLGVVFIDGILQVYEDLSRHKADKEANASIAKKYDPIVQDFVECRWYELEVGNIIKVQSRDTIPADIVIFAVAEKSLPDQGICYVETKSLDGETNLKLRSALQITYNKVIDRYLIIETDFAFVQITSDRPQVRLQPTNRLHRDGAS
jgi:magnesium-transporting ATPase (P-type)